MGTLASRKALPGNATWPALSFRPLVTRAVGGNISVWNHCAPWLQQPSRLVQIPCARVAPPYAPCDPCPPRRGRCRAYASAVEILHQRCPPCSFPQRGRPGRDPLCSPESLRAEARPPFRSSSFLPVSAPAVTMASQLFVTPGLSFLTTGPHLSVESNDRADRSLICAVTFPFITISIQACGGTLQMSSNAS